METEATKPSPAAYQYQAQAYMELYREALAEMVKEEEDRTMNNEKVTLPRLVALAMLTATRHQIEALDDRLFEITDVHDGAPAGMVSREACHAVQAEIETLQKVLDIGLEAAGKDVAWNPETETYHRELPQASQEANL